MSKCPASSDRNSKLQHSDEDTVRSAYIKSERANDMNTTAIALFGSRISPRFDCAQEFMVITCDEKAVTEKHIETIRDDMAIMKVRRLSALKVDTLICGGIDESSREHLNSHGIKVLANKKGEVDDTVTSYVSSLSD